MVGDNFEIHDFTYKITSRLLSQSPVIHNLKLTLKKFAHPLERYKF